FVSDSVCYENIISGNKIRCDLPLLEEGRSSYYRDLWEVEREGDFIKIVHWYSKPIEETYINSEGDTIPSLGSGITTHFIIDHREQEEITYITKKIKLSSQLFQGRASTGISRASLVISWKLFDLNDDGLWDRLKLTWVEDSPTVRVIYCHAE
ncbi:MAG: hypothetical protein WAW07_06260, partial [Bacteroidales bacterium]